MHVHLSRHTRGFLILPNSLLQDRGLTYTARGLLGDLLSRPDGWREDGRHMADTSPQGRLAVAKALRELTAAGYYRVLRVRQSDGTFVSEAHVYDTPQRDPQVTPTAVLPGPGGATADRCGTNPVKDQGKHPPSPHPAVRPGSRRAAARARPRRLTVHHSRLRKHSCGSSAPNPVCAWGVLRRWPSRPRSPPGWNVAAPNSTSDMPC